MRSQECSKCHGIITSRNTYYNKRIEEAGGLQAMLDSYVCRKCRPPKERKSSNYTIPELIETSPTYYELKVKLKEQIDLFALRDLSNRAIQELFLENIKKIMLEYNIVNYRFVINSKGKIQAIVIDNVPFIDSIKVNVI